jgi:8-oxo-dGTP diphosphatase
VNDHAGAPMHVMAGVLVDEHQRVLLAQRPAGKHLAGMWEFPGGKLEPGEPPQRALARELHEELGIHIDSAHGSPLIRVPWRYGERGLLLDAWRVTQWQGTPASLEGQALQWLRPGEVDPSILAPADRPILQALRLPGLYAITPAHLTAHEAEPLRHRIITMLEQDGRLVQLRLPEWSRTDVRAFAASLQSGFVARHACLLLNGDIEGARDLGQGVGVHLKSSQLLALNERPLPLTQVVGCSCHNALELEHAVRIGADFATLSPVAPTASHPDAPVLGWSLFQTLAEAAALPVYALGGLSPAQLLQAGEHGAQGVAGIRGFW